MTKIKTYRRRFNKDEISNRIKGLRGSRTQIEYADLLGVRQGYVTKYENGVMPEPITLYKIARLSGVSMEWILTGKDSEGLSAPVIPEPLVLNTSIECTVTSEEFDKALTRDNYVCVPVVRRIPKLKKPGRITEKDIERMIVVKAGELRNPESAVGVKMNDTGMVPVIDKTMIVVIDRASNIPRKLNKKLVAAFVDGNLYIRWLSVSRSSYILEPENKDFDPLFCDRDKVNPIYGRVVYRCG